MKKVTVYVNLTSGSYGMTMDMNKNSLTMNTNYYDLQERSLLKVSKNK